MGHGLRLVRARGAKAARERLCEKACASLLPGASKGLGFRGLAV